MTNWWEGGKPDAVAPYAGGKLPGVDADGNGVVYPADGLSAGASIVRAFPFAFDTPDLITGAALYTPTPGDILLDAWIEIGTAWDGTTPLGDVGSFVGSVFGWWAVHGPTGALPMSAAADDDGIGLTIGTSGSPSLLAALTAQSIFAVYQVPEIDAVPFGPAQFMQLGAMDPTIPAKFTTADPIKVCVSQDGTNTGDDPGSTQGAATLYLVTATPVGA